MRPNGDGTLRWFFGEGRTFAGWGKASDTPILGDWDGDGVVQPGAIRDKGKLREIHLQGMGSDPIVVGAENEVVVGDWDGDGVDQIGYMRANPDGTLRWFLLGTLEIERWGVVGDTPVVGDWNGDGADRPGVVRSTAEGREIHRQGILRPPIEVLADDEVIVGDWDGNDVDQIGAVRTNPDRTLGWFLGGVRVVESWGRAGDELIVAGTRPAS